MQVVCGGEGRHGNMCGNFAWNGELGEGGWQEAGWVLGGGGEKVWWMRKVEEERLGREEEG